MKKITTILLPALLLCGASFAADDVVQGAGDVQTLAATYVTQLTDGAYYRIVSVYNGTVITESDAALVCQDIIENNYAQFWQLISTADGWQIKNALFDDYVEEQTSNIQYVTSSQPGNFAITLASETTDDVWFVSNVSNGKQFRWSADKVVAYNGEAVQFQWQFEQIDITDEEIANAKEEYDEYSGLLSDPSSAQKLLDNLFEDKACTTLKSDIASLTDEGLEQVDAYAQLPGVLRKMVLKIKNDTWELPASDSPVTDSYERFFRIADYQPYSHYEKMADEAYTCMSYKYGKLSGPTGIFLNPGDVLCIYVDQKPKSNCTLQVELVSTDGDPANHQTGETTDLTSGLNVLQVDKQVMVYIFYQLDNPDKKLADYPDIKIHIEGGTINGYWDATRGMTNQDWANIKNYNILPLCPVINLKTQHLVFAMSTTAVVSAIQTAHQRYEDEQEDVEKLMRIWEMMCKNERRYLGIEEFEPYARNVWNAFSHNSDSYMYATNYGTYYVEYSLADVMNYYKLTHMSEYNAGAPLWGPSHEMGHCHQAPIKLVGTVESSNNLFSNINLFEQGVSITQGMSAMLNFDNYLANGSAWQDRDIWLTTRMFFQLYLYFHQQGHDTDFLPKLFKALRADPIDTGTYSSSLTADTDGDGVDDIKGGYRSYGKNDYLHFAKKVCDIAEADLSEFFESYGMFVPVENKYVDDYGNYLVTTTQDDIDEAKQYMHQYPKKLGNLMFIDDHIELKPADPDNKFEAVPASDGMKVNCERSNGYKVGTAGETGDYELYDGHAEYDVDGDYYSYRAGTISFKGTGYLGHKFYDLDGNLLWACNKASASVPSNIRNLIPDNVIVVAAEENMRDVPCPYYSSGIYPVYKLDISFPDGNNKQWWANGNIDTYLPTNAFALVTSSGVAPDDLLASVNVINADSTAQNILIDGDTECRIPQPLSATSLRFTKSGEGYQALNLPFAVEEAVTIEGDSLVYDANVPAGSPVVIEGDADIQLTSVSVNEGDYLASESGNILASDGTAVVEATDISPFVYLFPDTFELGTVDAINQLLSAPDADATSVYDLSGRRMARISKPGLYIVNGVKTFVR